MPFDFYQHHEYLKVFNKEQQEKNLLTTYNLSTNSVFFDLGAYDGAWSKNIYEKYQCHIHAFEPVKHLYETTKENLKTYSKIQVYPVGLGGTTRTEQITIDDNASSILTEGNLKESIKIISMKDMLNILNIGHVDLIKINIEGAEYELLEHMISESLLSKFSNIQVQFHANTLIKNYDEKIFLIRDALSKTHKSTYCYDYIWENWELV